MDGLAPRATVPPGARLWQHRAPRLTLPRLNPANLAQYAPQPYQGTDVVAYVFGLIAVLSGALWLRDREPGMGWFGLSMATLSLWTATTALHIPVDRFISPLPWGHVVVLGLAFLALGLVDYLGVPRPWRRAMLAAMLVPVLAYTVLIVVVVATGAQILRTWANLLVSVTFLAMAGLTLWAARREPGAGHGLVGLALLGIPVMAVCTAVLDVDSVALSYWASLPVVLFALTLFTVSLLRRRLALEAEVVRRTAAEAELTRLNASLEHIVAERTADLQSMLAGLESFNRSVSHDLRGPLGGIAGAARLADESLRRGDDTLARRVLPLIADQAEQGTRLVAALLSLARVGDGPMQWQVVDLRALVEAVVAQLQPATAGAAQPRIDVAPLPAVQADPELLRPVFTNLIGNAIKFTRAAAGGRIEVGASVTGPTVEVWVRDNGVGFAPEQAERLFAPFVRLHAKGYDGHGIGLSIVRRAVERHGGQVRAEAAPGGGAVFRFSLPAAMPVS
jgi:signal transduction histidine kinase